MEKQTSLRDLAGRLKLLIFDLDGTLVDSSKPMGKAFNHTLKQMNVREFSREETDSFIGTPLSDLFMNVMNRPGRDDIIEKCIRIYRKKYLEIFLDESYLYDGVAETIPGLASRYRIALATTKKTDIARMTLEHFKLIEHFELILGFDSVALPKPSPEIINRTLHELKVKKEEALMIGDSIYDLKAASSAGVRSCIVSYGFDRLERLKLNRPDIMIDSFFELQDLLWDRS